MIKGPLAFVKLLLLLRLSVFNGLTLLSLERRVV
jgi:hypothetical protein